MRRFHDCLCVVGKRRAMRLESGLHAAALCKELQALRATVRRSGRVMRCMACDRRVHKERRCDADKLPKVVWRVPAANICCKGRAIVRLRLVCCNDALDCCAEHSAATAHLHISGLLRARPLLSSSPMPDKRNARPHSGCAGASRLRSVDPATSRADECDCSQGH